jgi:hypothetical protein
MQFTRGQGPLVSFLMPTRTRLRYALQSIESLYLTCDDPRSIEVIARSDADDLETAKLPSLGLNGYNGCNSIKLIIGPKLNGYFSLHHFYNDCAALATGDWLMVWNDDCKMVTQHWDTLLANLDYSQFPDFKGNSTVACFNVAGIPENNIGCFPAMRRASYQLMGRFSCHCHNDLWVNDVFTGAGANIYWDGIKVHHDFQLNDAVQLAGDRAQSTSQNDYPGLQGLRDQHSALLKTRL